MYCFEVTVHQILAELRLVVGRFIDALVHPDTLHVSIHMMEYRYDERFYSDSLICFRYIL